MSLNAAIADAVVGEHHHYLGRGPARAEAFSHDNTIVVLMHDILTRAERSLVDDGQGDAVIETRRQLQRTMESALIARVEELTGRTVLVLLSDSHLGPDVAADVFVLDAPLV